MMVTGNAAVHRSLHREVVALIVNGRPKAYPVETLKSERLTHDEVGGKPYNHDEEMAVFIED